MIAKNRKKIRFAILWGLLLVACNLIVLMDRLFCSDLSEFVFRVFTLVGIVMVNLAIVKYVSEEK